MVCLQQLIFVYLQLYLTLRKSLLVQEAQRSETKCYQIHKNSLQLKMA